VLNAAAGSITTTAETGIRAESAQFLADRGIGSRDNPLRVDAGQLSADTRIGDVHLFSTNDLVIQRVATGEGAVSLTTELGAIRVAVEQDGPAHVQATGRLNLAAEAGIGGFGLSRLLVDVPEVAISNGRSGDVIVSGVAGLKIGSEGVRSLASDGNWVVLMGGSGPVDSTDGTVSQVGGSSRIAMFNGRSLVAESDLVAQATLARMTERFVRNVAAQSVEAEGPMKAMNDQLLHRWAAQSVQNLMDRLSTEPMTLSEELDSSLRSMVSRIERVQGRTSAFTGSALGPQSASMSERLEAAATDVGPAIDPVVSGAGTAPGSEVAVPVSSEASSKENAPSEERTRPTEQRLGARGFDALNQLLELAARGPAVQLESSEGQDDEKGEA
jgi:hypothetical protein